MNVDERIEVFEAANAAWFMKGALKEAAASNERAEVRDFAREVLEGWLRRYPVLKK